MMFEVSIVEQAIPRLIITEQPVASGRFRYLSEGKSHGGIPGVQSTELRKTFPTVEIVSYKGPARIYVQLVTDDPEPKLHVHSLVGKHCKGEVCYENCGPGEMRSQFPYLEIQRVKMRDAKQIIEDRLAKQYPGQMTDTDRKQQAKSDVERMNLSTVRLKFIAYLPDENNELTQMLSPVYSTVITDNKSTLKIIQIIPVDSPATGGAKLCLLCDKVQKDDIQVRMFEVDDSGNEIWNDYCRFSSSDVHKQNAIVVNIPAYKTTNIVQPAKVYIQLQRRTDGQLSDPQQFTYTPVYHENDLQPTKRKQANYGVGNSNMSHINALGVVTNTFRTPMKRNEKPKVDHHAIPIDPSALMQHFTRASVKTQLVAQQSLTCVGMQSAMRGTSFSQSMVMSSSTQQCQNFQTLQSNAVVPATPTVFDISAMTTGNVVLDDVLKDFKDFKILLAAEGGGINSLLTPTDHNLADTQDGSPAEETTHREFNEASHRSLDPVNHDENSSLRSMMKLHRTSATAREGYTCSFGGQKMYTLQMLMKPSEITVTLEDAIESALYTHVIYEGFSGPFNITRDDFFNGLIRIITDAHEHGETEMFGFSAFGKFLKRGYNCNDDMCMYLASIYSPASEPIRIQYDDGTVKDVTRSRSNLAMLFLDSFAIKKLLDAGPTMTTDDSDGNKITFVCSEKLRNELSYIAFLAISRKTPCAVFYKEIIDNEGMHSKHLQFSHVVLLESIDRLLYYAIMVQQFMDDDYTKTYLNEGYRALGMS